MIHDVLHLTDNVAEEEPSCNVVCFCDTLMERMGAIYEQEIHKLGNYDHTQHVPGAV
jgi:hypothetical protein